MERRHSKEQRRIIGQPLPAQKGTSSYRKAEREMNRDDEHMISDGDSSSREDRQEQIKRKRDSDKCNNSGFPSFSSDGSSSDNDGSKSSQHGVAKTTSTSGSTTGRDEAKSSSSNTGKRDRSKLRKGKWTVSFVVLFDGRTIACSTVFLVSTCRTCFFMLPT